MSDRPSGKGRLVGSEDGKVNERKIWICKRERAKHINLIFKFAEFFK